MATIVKNISTDEKYILVGVGFGAYKTSKSSVFIANQLPKSEEGEEAMAALCDKNGKIKWVDSSQIEIVEIDGREINTVI